MGWAVRILVFFVIGAISSLSIAEPATKPFKSAIRDPKIYWWDDEGDPESASGESEDPAEEAKNEKSNSKKSKKKISTTAINAIPKSPPPAVKPPNKLTTDEFAPPPNGGGAQQVEPPREETGMQTTPGSASAKGGSQKLPYWIPICFFFDPTARDNNSANSVVKTVVDNFGKCGVAVKPLMYTVNPGTYNPHDPGSINNGAQTKCNANEAFNVSGSAAQTHPNSMVASDIMCGQDPENPTQTSGCSGLGNDGGVPQTSICDSEGAGAATHELGHSVGMPGRGGQKLVNEGEAAKKGKTAPPAGLGLELQIPGVTRLMPLEWRFWMEDVIYQASNPPGSAAPSGGFNAQGCASIQGGANVNDRNITWNPSKTLYFKHRHPSRWINLLDGKKLFKRGAIAVKGQPTPSKQIPPRLAVKELPPLKEIELGTPFGVGVGSGHKDLSTKKSMTPEEILSGNISSDSFFEEKDPTLMIGRELPEEIPVQGKITSEEGGAPGNRLTVDEGAERSPASGDGSGGSPIYQEGVSSSRLTVDEGASKDSAGGKGFGSGDDSNVRRGSGTRYLPGAVGSPEGLTKMIDSFGKREEVEDGGELFKGIGKKKKGEGEAPTRGKALRGATSTPASGSSYGESADFGEDD